MLDYSLILAYLTGVLSSDGRKFCIWENVISKILQTISSFLSKISR